MCSDKYLGEHQTKLFALDSLHFPLLLSIHKFDLIKSPSHQGIGDWKKQFRNQKNLFNDCQISISVSSVSAHSLASQLDYLPTFSSHPCWTMQPKMRRSASLPALFPGSRDERCHLCREAVMVYLAFSIEWVPIFARSSWWLWSIIFTGRFTVFLSSMILVVHASTLSIAVASWS